jgi:Domain of unknown function (DUF4178)
VKTSCPNCGAEIEFRYDDSFVRICGHCHNAVERTDRGLETLGQVADLVPIDSPLKLFSEGHFGSASFLLVGMAQIRHAQGGIWQEWYAKFDNRWGWLAEAQGRYYLTFHDDAWKPIDLRELAPGHVVQLPVRGTPHAMTVAEATSGTFISARGELPYKLVPNETFHYADLSDGKGAFATIDYGDGEEPPALYVGVQVPLADLKLSGSEVAPVVEKAIASKRLACPNCNAPIELRAGDQTQRAVCAYCNAMLDTTSGALEVLSVLKQKPQLQVPLGSKGTFIEGELTVIGYLQRSANVDGSWWPFEEYLLYRPDLGFRWLVESDGHWSYVQPIAAGAVDAGRLAPTYDKVAFRSFQNAELRVDQVLGEVYWQVHVGETVSSDDYVAPPAMLSRELSKTEEDWSLSTYMSAREVTAAFKDAVTIGEGAGIAPNQPDPWTAASSVMAIAFLVLILVGIVFAIAAKDDRKLDQDLRFTAQVAATAPAVPTASLDPLVVGSDLDPELKKQIDAQLDQVNRQILADQGSGSAAAIDAAGSDNGPNVIFSDPIQIAGGQNIELSFHAPLLDNHWVYVAADLVNQATGDVLNLEGNIEYYSGYDDGDSWSEGSHESSVVVGPQPAGTYVIRFEGQTDAPTANVHAQLRQGVFRFAHLGLAMLVLGVPLMFVGLISYVHEKRRWENSTSGKPPFTPIGLIVLMFGGVFILIGAIIKSMGSSND